MYNQEEYIASEFKKNFDKIRKQPIVLYGISERTGKLLEQIPDYSVVGLMDGRLKSGEIWGKPILDEQQVVQEGIRTIIIVARSAVLRMIFFRIREFACKNRILVYDIHGNDLSVKYRERECDMPYYHLNWDALKNACKEHDIVTFDVFDTLLVRKTLFPTDIFEIVERQQKNSRAPIADFAKMRRMAEDRCYKRGQNPTIKQIYEELQQLTKTDWKSVKTYLDAEIKAEFMFIKPRESMREFFYELRREKQIYLISDMYLPGELIRKMLDKCGYDGYQEILVSCEYGCSKRSGLFERFLERFPEKKKILHIGDDEIADGMCARDAGIDAFHIMSGRELLENSVYCSILDQADSLYGHIMTGLFCQRAFDNPFVFCGRKGKLAVDDNRKMAYLFCAPVFVSFCVWLMQKIRETGCGYVLYPARDAYLLEKICGIIRDLQHVDDFPNGVYLYTSRRALNAATVFSREDIERVAGHEYDGDIRNLIRERFHVEIEEGEHFLGKESLSGIIDRYEKRILESCRQEREHYLQYLHTKTLSPCRKMACADFIAAGSVQQGLCRLLPETELTGFYFQKKKTECGEPVQRMKTCSFYEPRGEYEMDANIYQFYLFLELLLTSPEPTFDSIGADGRPLFMEEVRSPKQIALVLHMQEEVLSYARDLAGLLPGLMDEKADPGLPDRILGFLGKEYSEITDERVLEMTLADEYMAKQFNIFDRL